MRGSQAQFRVSVCLLSAIVGVLPLTAHASSYLALGDGVDHVYNGVPFEVWGFGMDTRHTPGSTEDTVLSCSRDVSTYGVATRFHIIQYCAWADNVPTGVTVGRITVFYEDESTSLCALVVGVNTAEWSCDNPALAPYLQHDKVAPAYSAPVDDNGDGTPEYYSRLFYVSIDLDAKPLASIQVPAGATRLFLGLNDGYEWSNNVGSVVVTLTRSMSVEIKPETLNLASQGVFTAFIDLPEGLDVALVLAECAGAAAQKCLQADGKLIAKFNCQDLVGVTPGEAVELTVTGELTDGTFFTATDTVRVIEQGGKKQ